DTDYGKDMVVCLDASPKVFNSDTVSAKRAGSKLRSRIVAEQSISKWCQMIEQLEDQVSEVLQEERHIKRMKLIFILLSVVFPNSQSLRMQIINRANDEVAICFYNTEFFVACDLFVLIHVQLELRQKENVFLL
ncbi:hypothetical protein MKW92_028269, partial [Papaver armeniacum]